MSNKETAKTEEVPTERRLRSISAADFALISDEFAKTLHPKDAMIVEIHALRAECDALRKVDDAMVERALSAFYFGSTAFNTDGVARQQVRAALDAALKVQP
jgi:hypothetical protein